MKKLSYVYALLLLGLASGASAATLQASPSSGNYAPGKYFPVNMLLDTQGKAIDGVDIHYLKYNPALLEVEDADPTRSGIQITAGSLMPLTLTNNVDTATGKIDFSQITSGGTRFTSSGAQVLATVNFRVIAGGQAPLTFDFTSGSSRDANVAASGADVLTAVTNGLYTLILTGGGTSGSSIPPQGGGGSGAAGPVSVPANFKAFGASDQVVLTWVNPPESGFVRIKILRKDGAAPSSANDGVVLYEGSSQEFTDTTAQPGVNYYYAIFSLDTTLKPSALAQAQTRLGQYTEAEVVKLIADAKKAALPPSSTPPSSQMPFAYRFTVALQEGVTHADVKYLQMLLNALGFTIASSGGGSPGNETTYYGGLTRQAVARFQAQHLPQISASDRGLVGPSTRAKLNELAATVRIGTGQGQATPPVSGTVFARNLGVGSRGEDVRRLQVFLNTHGFIIISSGDGSPGKETDYFGNLTRLALIKFQESYSAEILTPNNLTRGNGYFGPSTRKKMQELSGSSNSSIQPPASSNSAIQSLQQQLQQAQEQLNRLLNR